MYEALPAEIQAKMLPNKKVSDIARTASGVVVTCTDGSSYEGSMVIGADGAHSRVRRCMRDVALAAGVPENEVNAEQPFLTTYRAMWVRFPTQADLHPGNAMETHGRDCAIQLFAGEETSVIGVYERIATGPTQERARYGPADEEAFVRRWGHLPISRRLTLRDAFDGRCEAGMVNLEEGVVDRWSWDRIVLAGDAAHKFTPSTGAGCNNGIVDVASLVSQLHAAVRTAAAEPSTDELAAAFAAYQATRHAAVEAGLSNASRVTATATWQNGISKFVDRYILARHIIQKVVIDSAAPGIASTPALTFLEGGELPGGRVAWVKPAPIVTN
jgi:2-polyprenyl-6-methoxyphenol hydroxylase-like FAD-dependent oxidoreductase